MTNKQSPVISFKNYSFQYRAQKRPTLTNINLDIYPGERVLIAGPSGCGKSTLAGCINGLNPCSNPGEATGELIIDGVDATKSSIFELSAHVGTVLQDPDGQFIGLTVGEDIAFSLENSCMPQDEMHQITRKVAELVKINNHLDYAPHELSGGQKQRVSLAGVMVDQVKILLFDEPLANLDPATGKQTIELIDEIQKETDTTVVIIEHRLEDVLWRDVDRIILVSEGRILADLHPDELLATDLLAENGIPGATVSDCDALCRNHADTGEKTIPCRQGCTAGRRCKTVKAVVSVAYGRKAGVGERASFGSEKPEFWIHKRTADASGCKPDDPKRRDGQHRRKERSREINIFQTGLWLRGSGSGRDSLCREGSADRKYPSQSKTYRLRDAESKPDDLQDHDF